MVRRDGDDPIEYKGHRLSHVSEGWWCTACDEAIFEGAEAQRREAALNELRSEVDQAEEKGDPKLDTEALLTLAFALVEEACRREGVESVKLGASQGVLVWIAGVGSQGATLSEAFECAVQRAAERERLTHA
jgi:hypothetical protein